MTKNDFNKLEERVKKLEKAIFVKKQLPKINFKGLSGGINLLIKNQFFNSPKSVEETRVDLAREGYHYSRPSVDKLLRIDFVKNKKILTRIKEGKLWKYVLRK